MLRARHGWLLVWSAVLACNGTPSDQPAGSGEKPPASVSPGAAGSGPSDTGEHPGDRMATDPVAMNPEPMEIGDRPPPMAPDPAGTRTGNPNVPTGVVLLQSALARDESPDASSVQRSQLGTDNQAFAFDLYRRASEDAGEDNLFFSPYSISLALAMTYAGAEGETEREMASALHFALPEPELHAAFNAADLELQGRAQEAGARPDGSLNDGLRLEITNALFAQSGLPVREPFLDVLGVNYDAGVFELDFMTDTENARTNINRWVGDRTEQRIPELLAMGTVTDLTRLVLVNAVYFKSGWLTPFGKDATQDGPFHAPTADVTAPMMHGFGSRYMEGDGFVAVDLPYASQAVRMLVLLPDPGRFDGVQAQLAPATLATVLQGLSTSTYEVHLTMPKFSFRSQLKLNDALQMLGMQLAFTDAADFTGMVEDGDLRISAVVHEAFVAVDEKGTEAAAATAVVISGTVSVPPTPPRVDVVLDRPFIFAIYDEPTGQVLFLGRVMTPTQ